MGESSLRIAPRSSENIRTSVPRSSARRAIGTIVPSGRAAPIFFGKSKLGAVAFALWPDDTTAHLAKAVRCTKRHASLLIEGKRKPNARVAHAILGEIIS
jgi:hypothetical protein